MERLFHFLLRVVRHFKRNQGLLLAGAVAYHTLLSIVPLSIIALIVLTQFIDEGELILTLTTYLEMVIPGYSATLTEQATAFLDHRSTIGVIGFIGLLLFGSSAFSMLENAISVIFFQRVTIHRRNFFISAIIPYAYILGMGVGIVLVSVIVGVIGSSHLSLFGWDMNPGSATWVALYILGIIGEILLLASFYLILPVVRVRFRHALIGGITATLLWEITRQVLIWYYASISTVNVIYGSIATTVVALLSIEIVAVILLLGAQVIAELEQQPAPPAVAEDSAFVT